MKITQLNHVALHVTNLEASVRFYRDVLGLAVIDRPAFDFDGAWFGVGDGADRQEIHLICRPAKEAPFNTPRERHYAFRVDDIEAAASQLRRLGLDYSGPNPRPDGALQIFLRDPDGHLVELCQTGGTGTAR